MSKTLEELKKNKAFMDLTGKVYGDILVLSFVEKKGKHPMWDVECTLCNKKLVTSSTHVKNKVKGMGCGNGCSCRVNTVTHIDGGLTVVDVSTETFTDKFCTVDTDMYYKYMTRNKWYAYKAPHSKNYYTYAKIDNKRVALHRLILDTPADLVTDHENGDGLDNRVINLRAVTHKTNMRNLTLYTNNKYGQSGVYKVRSGRFIASIRLNGKQTHIGTYNTVEEAIEARKEAEVPLGYHDNHGRVRDEEK